MVKNVRLEIERLNPQSHHTGIEIDIFLWKRWEKRALNRTILELKYAKTAAEPLAFDTLNRTILELKSGYDEAVPSGAGTLNRTILELK